MIVGGNEVRVGLLGLGLKAYWPQFEGLRERLEGYLGVVEGMIEGAGRSVVRLGLVDDMATAVEAGHACRREDVDLLLIYVTTYALSSTVLPIVQRAKVPVILLNLQPELAMDYESFNRLGDRTAMTGEWLAWCSACPVPEIANVLRRLDIPFFQVTGSLKDDPACWTLLDAWLTAARVVKSLAHSKLGLMGHYYSGMLDIATDLAQVSGRFGLLIEQLEVDELSARRRQVSETETEERAAAFAEEFDVRPDCEQGELLRAARTAVALDGMVGEHGIDLLAYYYKGTGVAENEDTMSSIILGTSQLTTRGVPVAGEYEVKNAIAMKVLSEVGAGGSFTEIYALDFKEDLVLMGHDGPGHSLIAQDRVMVRPLEVYHGKVGRGLSVEMSVRHGPVTLLSIVEDRDAGFQFLIAEGESVPGRILEIGNTNSRYKFPLGARRFIESWNAHGPAHHCAIGVGHVAEILKKTADLLQIPAVQVC
ncbi:arabinose isomerase [Granulicella sibirica]|uniref:Putative L-arabinose isomerase n=1 Tax=Granulicella sibirica TaxID=2479048 RepID=A0A4Q0SWB9_9BACT|nr:arabinose isomerase [Granulicella sibirica]RXH54722.1 putative L-arabinose isomerase [Granulicella sibirica]